MCDELSVGDNSVIKKYDNIKLVNRYDVLQNESSNECEKASSVNPICDIAQGNKNVIKIKQRG